MSYNMSLPSSTRSATSATQTIFIHIDVEQRSIGYWHRELGDQFIHTITDANYTTNTATTSAAAASPIVVVLQTFPLEPWTHACPNASAGIALLPGLSILALANTHNHNRAGLGACHTRTATTAAPAAASH